MGYIWSIARERAERKRSLKDKIYHLGSLGDTVKAEAERRDGVMVYVPSSLAVPWFLCDYSCYWIIYLTAGCDHTINWMNHQESGLAPDAVMWLVRNKMLGCEDNPYTIYEYVRTAIV